MARVDFYLLGQSGDPARCLFACKLAEKAWRLDNSVHIQVVDLSAAERLDTLLWTFRDGSFVPHHVVAGGDDTSPVTIGFDPDNARTRDLLINLCDGVPTFANRFPRIAELVTADEPSRQKSRLRFTEYRSRGHTIETHELQSN